PSAPTIGPMKHMVAAALVLMVSGTGWMATQAQSHTQVAAVALRAREGYVTVTWRPVAGATSYEIERAGTVVGIWRPNRQVRQDTPVFADAGFVPGGTLTWRVRAMVGEAAQEWSAPVSATTLVPPGPAEFRTGFESRDG